MQQVASNEDFTAIDWLDRKSNHIWFSSSENSSLENLFFFSPYENVKHILPPSVARKNFIYTSSEEFSGSANSSQLSSSFVIRSPSRKNTICRPNCKDLNNSHLLSDSSYFLPPIGVFWDIENCQVNSLHILGYCVHTFSD